MKTVIQKAILMFILAFTFNVATGQSVLVPDTIDIYPGIPVVKDLLANDTLDPADTIQWIRVFHSWHIQSVAISPGVFRFTKTGLGNSLSDTGTYRIMCSKNNEKFVLSSGIYFRIHDRSLAFLDTNDVRALLHANGTHFYGEEAQYFVPKGSAKTTIFTSSCWIGGKDEQGNLHLAAQRYGQGSLVQNPYTLWDFYPGPVMDPEHYSIFQDTLWSRIWEIRKEEIEYHRAHWWEPDYGIPEDILEWPGNGDTTLGQAWHLAPFYDMDGDGIYEPLQGDNPEVRGDQALYFIFNDDRNNHMETGGEKLRLEVHGMAYAFDIPADSAMKTTIFMQYRFINRSQHTYDSTFIGFFTDFDLGFPLDDYVGCDVERNLYFAYNGRPVDGSGQAQAYGENPPVQSFLLLSGPLMDPDDLDNPRFDNLGNQLCDFSVNGSNFGDNITDNERYGLTGFQYINSSMSGVPPYLQDPDSAVEYYNYLKGKFRNGSPIYYGGNGSPSAGGYGPVTRFMYPGMSDSINWGPGCVNVDPKEWTEHTANNNPSDRRALGEMGPFTFHPGDVQEVDFAYVWARDYVNGNSLGKLQEYADQINLAFINNQLSNGQQFYGISDQDKPSFKLYPNPAKDFVTIEFDKGIIPVSAEIISSGGITLRSCKITGSKTTLDLSGIPAGLYVIKANTSSGTITKKIMVR